MNLMAQCCKCDENRYYQITVSLTNKMINQLDNVRGGVPRSQFVRTMLEEKLGSQIENEK